MSSQTTPMASKYLRIFMVMTLAVCPGLSTAQAINHLRCSRLARVFPDCPCRPATEEKGSVYAIVDCSNKSLTRVPTLGEPYDATLYKLILRGNAISTLTDSSFQSLKIEYLDLSGNPLSSVGNNTFLSMKDTLRTIEIDGDSRSMPPKEALKLLTNLESLTMRNYNVQFLDQQHQFFLPFPHLRYLTLADWTTQHIESESFLGPTALKSLTITGFKLANLPLEALSNDPFGNLEMLKIASTSIEKVTNQVFQKLAMLKMLDLSNNKITELEMDCFKGIEDTLSSLNLYGNLLNDNNKLSGLSNLINLNSLDLSFNTFRVIPSIPNLGTTKPLTLLLANNEIDTVPSNAFNGYAQLLETLNLKSNKIRAMDGNSFAQVNRLKSLDLSIQLGPNSDLVQIPFSLTNSASTIQKIDLSQQDVDGRSLWLVIRELTALRDLNLLSNGLRTIPDRVFQKASTLEHLNLAYNSLSQINQKSLYGVRQLKTLNLEGNNLQTVPSCLFHEFDQTYKITLTLKTNPIKCDCKIKTLLEKVKTGLVEISRDALCSDDGQPIITKDPASLVCQPPYEEPTCEEYSSTSSPITRNPSEPTPPQLLIQIPGLSTTSINTTWSISDSTFVKSFKIGVTSDRDAILFTKDDIDKTTRRYSIPSLPANTQITACITAYFSNDFRFITSCAHAKTLGSGNPDKKPQDGDDSDSPNTAIIVGCVVAGVAFIGVMVAIIILFVVRKKPKNIPDNHHVPTQPRNFSKAELPSMSGDTRMFTRPKKKQSPESKGMQVVAISDGQAGAGAGARVGRVNKVFQDDYEHMENRKRSSASSNGHSVYENDHSRELPPTPGQDSIPPSYPGGYYNQAFQDESKYEQIEVEL